MKNWKLVAGGADRNLTVAVRTTPTTRIQQIGARRSKMKARIAVPVGFPFVIPVVPFIGILLFLLLALFFVVILLLYRESGCLSSVEAIGEFAE